jgi:hypothetical protein
MAGGLSPVEVGMPVQQITEYIRQHRNHNHPNIYYTREAIDRQLLDAGYMQGDIADAWNALRAVKGQADMPVDKPTRINNSPTFWLVLIGFIMLSYSLPAFFLAISPRDACCGSINFGYAWPGLAVAPVMQLAALIWSRRIVATNRPVAMGLRIGVLLTVVVLPLCAIVALIIIFARIGI